MQKFISICSQIQRKVLTFPLYKRWSNFKVEMENQKLNREYIGEDREGNRYYQYYSYFGLPTKREIDFKDRHQIVMQDLVYYDWLMNRVSAPPSDWEIGQFYEQEKIRKYLGQEWDRKEQEQIDAFRQERIKLQNEREKRQLEFQSQQNQAQQDTLDEIKSKINIEPDQSQLETGNFNAFEQFQPKAWSPKIKAKR